METCLLEIMLETPFSDITVTDLCAKSGLTRKTFYRLFSNKEAVLHALVDHTLINYAAFQLYGDSISPEAPAEFQRFFAYWRQNRLLLDVLSKNQLFSMLLERVMQHVAHEEPNALRRFGADNPEYGTEILLFHLSGIMGLIFHWHHNGFQKSVPEMAKLLEQLMTHPPIQIPRQ